MFGSVSISTTGDMMMAQRYTGDVSTPPRDPSPNPHPNSHPNQAALRAQQHKDEQAHRRIVAKLAEGNSRHVRL